MVTITNMITIEALMTFEKNLISKFECPVCFKYMNPPIRLCLSGHSYCNQCFEKLKNCALCRANKSPYRCIVLEQIHATLTFPCRYLDQGCNFSGKGDLMTTHQEYCEFSSVLCPLSMATNETIVKSLISNFECPVCFKYMHPPIGQCVSGHSFCTHCFETIENCALCKAEKSPYRCILLEQIHACLLFPCKYCDQGCIFSGKSDSLTTHEEYCEFSSVSCPLRFVRILGTAIKCLSCGPTSGTLGL
ncbi:E3 ubiquitin-protein ligase sina-like isoform X2 [Diabrotica virgifera virgifera]|uniref:RING-type domain-containing protein n=1 Tax=Diabrotica virgifera virgifera TaxID=50390 RepID=A0ABM5KLN8_DIAVI|nr:E3 ubiquitin-protein ligase sina-like isoform X2 [Diabrotica virgifera virgifera]